MTIRNWLKLFRSTLMIGAAAAVAAGLVLALGDEEFRRLNTMEIGYNVLMMALAGLMFSILSQMGFFSYMMLNYIARDIFQKPSTWTLVQLFFIVTVPLELWMFLWKDTAFKFIIGVGLIFLPSIGSAFWKVRMTNGSAFVPTLFFVFLATLLETAIAIQVNSLEAALLMAIPLLSCNAWQILRLHTLLKKEES